MSRLTVLFAFLVSASLARSADEFQGADAVLKRIAQAQSEPGKAGQEANPLVEILNGFDALKNQPEALKHAEAATRWAGLFDRFRAVPRGPERSANDPHYFRQPISNAPLIEALPPTAAWDAIATPWNREWDAIPRFGTQHSGFSRRSFAETRTNANKRWKCCGAPVRAQNPLAWRRKCWSVPWTTSSKLLQRRMGDKEAQVALFEESLKKRETNTEPSRLFGFLLIPDLAKLASPEKAESLLVRAFALGEELTIAGTRTQRLAANLALKHIDLLKKRSGTRHGVRRRAAV